MATKPAAKPEAPKGEAPVAAPPRNRSKQMLIMIIAGVLLLAILGGGAALFLTKKKPAATDGEEETSEVTTKKKAAHAKPPVFMQLEPFTVNLQPEAGDQFLQVVLNFQVGTEKEAEEVKTYMPAMRHQILMLLSSKKPSEISTVEGRETLAGEIKDKANGVLGFEEPSPKKKSKHTEEDAEESAQPVQAVLFTSFIIQ